MLPPGIKFCINKKNCDHAMDDGERGKAASFHLFYVPLVPRVPFFPLLSSLTSTQRGFPVADQFIFRTVLTRILIIF